ncbi:hypothetical protein E2C01_022653 [Portunus trituberculatus]|uniref:Uncharacterized protein n=1 Tax=Portunus trituberculatus TaxID=210409 RepID=A0A5B7E9G3_PORTR|nr:hypothetical protein [Portunus trituberculatus]
MAASFMEIRNFEHPQKINQHLYIEIVPIKVPHHPRAHACWEPPTQLANHTSDPFCARHSDHLRLFSLLPAFFGARFLAASISTSPGVTMATQRCVGCKRWLPGKALEPHSHCVSCWPAMCSAEDWCSECSHLSLLKFQVFVKDAEKRSAKEKWAKSSGGSSEKCSRRQKLASEAPWASRFVAVESDLATMKASIAQLSAVLLPLASSSTFSGFADGGASVRPPPRLVLGVKGPRFPPRLRPCRVAAGCSGVSLSVSPLPGLAPGVGGRQSPSVSSPALELAVGGVSLCAAPRSALPPVASGVPSPTVPGPSTELSGLGKVSMCAAPLLSLALGVRPQWFVGSQLPPFQSPTRALLVAEKRDFMQDHSLVGCWVMAILQARQACLPWACLMLHWSMSSQVPPRPVDAGADPGGGVVSQVAATGWPSFSEEVDEVCDDIPSGEAGTLDEEGAASFHELITSVRECLGLPIPSSLASTLQTGVELTSGTSRPGPTPLVLPRSPLALEVCREQLGCSLGIPNPSLASAKFALPRRWASRVERGYTPEGDSCGAPPLNDEVLHLVESKDLAIARGLASTARGVRAKAGRAIGS